MREEQQMNMHAHLLPHLWCVFFLLQYLKLRECEEIQDPDQRLKQLQDCHAMFKSTPALEKNAHYIEESIKLLKKQKEIKVREETMFTPLVSKSLVILGIF